MSKAKTHRRGTVKTRNIRMAKAGNAREAIGPIAPGCEVYCLSYGNYSLIDALVVLLEQTGPADVILSTWTAATADLTIASGLMERAQIRSLRMIVDRSFLTRQPAYCQTMRRLFGDACIRTTRTHAKFAVIRNDTWSLAIRTSMNLNENPRLENLEISDDPALCDFLEQVTDEIFREQDPGVFNGELPLLESVPNVQRQGGIQAGQVETFGKVKPG